MITNNGILEIGKVSWTNKKISEKFSEFMGVYDKRVVKNNKGGMKITHSFYAWFLAQMLQPKIIIESGVWKGHGTWLFEKACPNARLICLDPCLDKLEYISKKATYSTNDFSYLDIDRNLADQTLCFFDDHQDALKRMMEMRWKGLRKAIFEDNYPINRGDCYSLKKIISQKGYKLESEKCGSYLVKLKTKLKQFLNTNLQKDILENKTHLNEVIKNLEIYYECPPLYKNKLTRWGDSWENPDYPTKPPVFSEYNDEKVLSEYEDYTWMTYIFLKQK